MELPGLKRGLPDSFLGGVEEAMEEGTEGRHGGSEVRA